MRNAPAPLIPLIENAYSPFIAVFEKTLVTVKVRAFEIPPPGEGLKTVI